MKIRARVALFDNKERLENKPTVSVIIREYMAPNKANDRAQEAQNLDLKFFKHLGLCIKHMIFSAMLVPSVIFKPQSLLSSFIPEYKTVI
jgi:hypothetical protein